MSKMNPEIKARWVAALRSGEYKQANGVLRNGDAFCCLGVLCNLHAQAHPEIAARQTDPDAYMGESVLPPVAVYHWAGLDYSTRLKIRGKTAPPENHNDGKNGCRRRTFAEIADAIEGQL